MGENGEDPESYEPAAGDEAVEADVPEADALDQRDPPAEAERKSLGDLTRDADERDLREQRIPVDWDYESRRDAG
jgi:hypothetical protein